MTEAHPMVHDTQHFIDLQNKIKLFCNHCGQVNEAPLSHAGSPVTCADCGEYLIVPKQRYAPFIVVDDFYIIEKVGEGGAGTVYRAHQITLDRPCGLKILHNRHGDKGKFLSNLIEEGRIAGRLNHPNIVQCYAIGQDDNTLFYAMEYVHGKNLKEILNEKWRLSPSRSLEIISQVADALNYCWIKERMVHRDIKPDNIMVTNDGDIKLTDMGLASSKSFDKYDPNNDSIEGSPHYIPPEQILGHKQDCRSDIYSLGIVLYQCLTGQKVFNASNAMEICQMHLNEVAPRPSTLLQDIPLELEEIIMKMIAKKPEDRYTDYGILKADLQDAKSRIDLNATTELNRNKILDEKSVTKPKYAKIAAIIIALFVTASLAFTLGGKSQEENLSRKAPVKVERHALEEDLITEHKTPPADPLTPPATEAPIESIEPKEEEAEPTLQPGDIIISKIMPNPTGYDGNNEWLEIQNNSSLTAKLDNWYIQDQEKGKVLINTEIAPGAKLKIQINTTDMQLNNSGDSLELFTADNISMDRFDYSRGQVFEGQSLNR